MKTPIFAREMMPEEVAAIKDPAQTWISPNLTPGGELASCTDEQFITALRTDVTPSGRQLSAAMPQDYRSFYDDELQAIWLSLQSLPKLPQYTEKRIS